MGLTHVTVKLSPATGGPRAYEAEFLVDTGAADTLAPASALHAAGFTPMGKTSYELADGRVVEYEFGAAKIEFMGELTVGRVIFGPDEAEPHPVERLSSRSASWWIPPTRGSDAFLRFRSSRADRRAAPGMGGGRSEPA